METSSPEMSVEILVYSQMFKQQLYFCSVGEAQYVFILSHYLVSLKTGSPLQMTSSHVRSGQTFMMETRQFLFVSDCSIGSFWNFGPLGLGQNFSQLIKMYVTQIKAAVLTADDSSPAAKPHPFRLQITWCSPNMTSAFHHVTLWCQRSV